MSKSDSPTKVPSSEGLGLEPERAAFEAFCVKRWCGDRNALGRNPDDHPKHPGEYTMGNVEFAWRAWLAAPAASKPCEQLSMAVVDSIADEGCRNAAGGIYQTRVQEFATEVQRAFAQQNGLQVRGLAT